ncbi:hypothetical protein OSB04_un000720 [Centaurea solstitialis]|uniref:Uncharacterized protein n=1 Tax=Centaurea solstitialis TaxID=347529 RepID=A0AA38SH61_9ASTR|nr:hypothetical protein OSB04_un000720 [Centaurea solstitialis]
MYRHQVCVEALDCHIEGFENGLTSMGGFKCEPLFGCEREDNQERDTWRMIRRHVKSTADD